MRYTDILRNKNTVVIFALLSTIMIDRLKITEILIDNDTTIHCLESDLCNIFKYKTFGNVYFSCLFGDIIYFKNISNLDIDEKVIETELINLIAEISEVVNNIKIADKKIISIGLEYPNTLILEYL